MNKDINNEPVLTLCTDCALLEVCYDICVYLS